MDQDNTEVNPTVATIVIKLPCYTPYASYQDSRRRVNLVYSPIKDDAAFKKYAAWHKINGERINAETDLQQRTFELSEDL